MDKIIIKRKLKGFTLVELMLTLAVIVIISFTTFQSLNKDFENKQAIVLGEQIRNIGTGVNNYIVNHYNSISKLENSDGGALDIGPRTCDITKQTCEITTQTLVNDGLLPPTFSAKNIYGSGYKLIISRKGTSPYWNVSALIITDTPLSIGGSIRYDILGKAMQSAGIDSGMTRTASNKIDGYKGSWSANQTEYSNINKQGLLGYIAGYGSNSYSAFLRRDGTLPMTGDLNMGTKNIYGAANITASGKGTFGGEIEAGSWVHARNGYGDLMSFGGDAATDDYEIKLNADKTLSLHMSSNRTDLTTLKVTGGVAVNGNHSVTGNSSVSGNMNANGTITSGSNITAGNWLIAHNGGGNTMYIGGDGAPHANGTAGNDYEIKMDTAKPLTVWNTATSSDRAQTVLDVWGSQRVLGNLVVGASNTAEGSITASSNITSSGTVIGNIFQPTSVAVVGGACNSSGAISKDVAGYTLSCQSGKWDRQYKPSVIMRDDGVWAANSDFQSCNSDEVVVGGGGQCEDPAHHFIHFSAPMNNGWSIDCYYTDPQYKDLGSRVYALCMKK